MQSRWEEEQFAEKKWREAAHCQPNCMPSWRFLRSLGAVVRDALRKELISSRCGKLRRRTSQQVSHLGPKFRDCAADTLGKAAHFSPGAFRQHVLTLSSLPPPTAFGQPCPHSPGPPIRERADLRRTRSPGSYSVRAGERGVCGHPNEDFCRSFCGASET